ncbi:DUF4065 domain-containing protein [Halosquirtibacter laminarini]|uniref:DUF4065 domain-containing protein n=1 Tax=Halosquirtibacter laminarini TaxID=3374600 RepID=A0AC61NP46_9BACT|nr:DUF4065 domain-containing protein [Prolixibacteraceae bacterium]
MNYTALDIASFFIKKGVTPLKLQKLLYYTQVWYFVKTKKYLMQESFQAWIYGPVVYDVWNSFRFIRRSDNIPQHKAKEVDLTSIQDHLTEVWNTYGHLKGSTLVDLTHNELPWKVSRKGLLTNQPSNNFIIIDKSTLKDFYLTQDGRVPKVQLGDSSSLGNFSN